MSVITLGQFRLGKLANCVLKNRCFRKLWQGEHPETLLVMFFLFVFFLHIVIILGFLKIKDEITATPAQPLLMGVTMITLKAPQQVVSRPQAPKAEARPEKKPEAKKTLEKPIVKKTPVVAQQPVTSVPTETVTEVKSTPETSTATINQESKIESVVEQFTEASFRASYLHNPEPDYPAVAKKRDWHGLVKLRVQVTADGLSEQIDVAQSSGHDILDEAAIEAVKTWRFIPAKRGETTVSSSVIVPIKFKLNE